MVNSFKTHHAILRRQVWGLAALLAAIVLNWMAYGFYQPKILKQLEFVELAGWLGILQGLLCVIIEPLSGSISDRIQQRLGSRLPMISVGVVLAGIIFIAISLLTQQNLPIGIRWIVPLLMTAWVIAMIIFRGPAIALLTQFAPTNQLPQANAILVFVIATVGAIEPLFNALFYNVGASIALMIGAIALMLGAYILQLFTPKHSFSPFIYNQSKLTAVPNTLLILIFAIGLATGFEIKLLFSIFPQELQTQLPGLNVNFIASEILLVSAIACIPLSDWATDLGANKSILIGLGSMTGLMGLTVLNENYILAIALILAFGISFSLVVISIVPLVLAKIPTIQAGLGTGLYFGGTAGGAAIVSLLIKQFSLSSVGAFLLAEVAFLIVIGCIFFSKKVALR
jgi:MFS family permease